MRPLILATLSALLLGGCNGAGEAVGASNGTAAPVDPPQSGRPFAVTEIAKFDQPWAMTFIPGPGRRALITEKRGRLLLWSEGAQPAEVAGVPTVDYGGQGGLGDVAYHDGYVFLSWVEAGPAGTRGAAVGRGRLIAMSAAMPGAPVGYRLDGFQTIWRQHPKVDDRGHFGHRLAFGPDGMLYITNGDRQKFTPAQDPAQTLGKIVRLNADGSAPRDNPWSSRGGVTAQLWTMGHRNPLGLAFDAQGRLWEHEMGPQGGDEFNLIERGKNYGYPIVSNGSHYDGKDIPDHSTRPEFAAPKITWNGVSPAGLIVYSGRMFPQWRGDAFLGGLSGKALIRVDLDGATARQGDRWDMGERIREVEEGPDGAIYLLEDERGGSGGRLLRLTPGR
ncbi:MAG TPA: PQQ-dependent sugar dehydrogenase [Allosphingosinicella sp.]|jgi:glucose/arabinose dehydrogenase